ncbi:hypothetical protein NST17_04795 [Caldifermentibacillus hisashii]|uniref:Uncharacterized protein n=1 Tax=Caldifermentibacillus hisashii TaxID=996558 RepID=A0ABU9JUK3_9BACI
MATSPVLVVVLRQETLFFGDEPHSRHHFTSKKTQFWRRNPFSSPFLGENCSILATSPVLVVVLRREMLNFGDEPCSHHYFGQKILFYIDETSQPSLKYANLK